MTPAAVLPQREPVSLEGLSGRELDSFCRADTVITNLKDGPPAFLAAIGDGDR